MFYEVLSFTIALVLSLIILWLVRIVEKNVYFRKVPRGELITGVGILACIDFLILFLVIVLFNAGVISSVFTISALSSIVNASIWEESIFRAGMIGLFKSKFGDYKLGIILSSVIWGVGHRFFGRASSMVIPYFIVVGFVYGYSYKKYGLVSCIFLHSLSNLTLAILIHLL